MLISLRIIVFSILIISHGKARSVESVPNNSEPSSSYNLPTELSSGTIITIYGKMKIDSTLGIRLLKTNGEDFTCAMTFLPQKELVLQDSMEFPYIVRQNNDLISYAIQMDARSVDQTMDFIEMYFESDHGGWLTLNRCQVDSLSNIQKIVVTGKQSVTNLTFNYQNYL